jgi:hypothetical protein
VLLEDLCEQVPVYENDMYVGRSRTEDQYYYSQAVAIRYEDERVPHSID